nr:DegT/DnrJ/EryC1/StrS family aminotransferase [Pectobacterium colocasium]
MKKPIYVTSPLLPPLEEFIPYLEEIWENKWLTNNGPFHQQLEQSLAEYLGVQHLSLFSNGTLALLLQHYKLCVLQEKSLPHLILLSQRRMHYYGTI